MPTTPMNKQSQRKATSGVRCPRPLYGESALDLSRCRCPCHSTVRKKKGATPGYSQPATDTVQKKTGRTHASYRRDSYQLSEALEELSSTREPHENHTRTTREPHDNHTRNTRETHKGYGRGLCCCYIAWEALFAVARGHSRE